MLSHTACKEFDREWLLSLFLHELSHILPARPVECDVPANRVEGCSGRGRPREATPGDCRRIPEIRAPDHGRDFHRIALHLHLRATMAGEFASLDLLGGEPVLDLPTMFMLWNAFGHEPARMLNLSFDEILARPEPPKFRGLWRESLAYFKKNNPTPDFMREAG